MQSMQFITPDIVHMYLGQKEPTGTSTCYKRSVKLLEL